MSTEIIIAVVGLGISFCGTAGSILVVVYSAGQMRGRFDALSEKLAEAVAEMREARAEKQKVTAHEVRIGQLEKVVENLARKLSGTTLQAVQAPRGRTRSRPDINGGDE